MRTLVKDWEQSHGKEKKQPFLETDHSSHNKEVSLCWEYGWEMLSETRENGPLIGLK